MMEEIPLVDPEPKESTFPEKSGLRHDLVVSKDDHLENRITIPSRIMDQGNSVFSRQTLYLKLASDGNQSDDYDLGNFVQESSCEYAPSRNKQCRAWLCYILPRLLIASLIFLAGFGFAQIVSRHSSKCLNIILCAVYP
ncbi:unnamed protein product [Rotaria sordida]|uniref:Uncharacterized protein n=1 Tax=Rotaria sordida TaxID=392033 RepID=A0A818ZV04_9BILA|nr:unnamed protein product [Rotaria sordida]